LRNLSEGISILLSGSNKKIIKEKFEMLAERAEYDFNISVEFINGTNSYWVPTPKNEIKELDCYGIIDIGDDQTEFEKIISLIHEIGHVLFKINNKLTNDRWYNLFEESLAWYLGYDYALMNGVEINLNEYAVRVEDALKLYSGR
tara:strand:- start:3185 stop:3619 length:435 start_codon:yes stop_codon:yes gene_type:complete